mmetsp:Transcript_30596/g.90697  ORF Transcript_30596/g.90697 Transcript_30596/m.90697 type:complete len:274 (+) Transcript_30596:177-998(+)
MDTPLPLPFGWLPERSLRFAARTLVTHALSDAAVPTLRHAHQQMTIERVKIKLSFHCGTSPSAMFLQLLDESGNVCATLSEDHRMLGYYSPHNGYTIHIVDTDPTSASAGGWLEDTALVEKYKMSDEDYGNREESYRRFKAKKLAEDPEWTLEKEMCIKRGVPYNPPAPKVTDPDHLKDVAEKISVGQRCKVEPGDRRGEVCYVGRVEGLPPGYWVGLRYDEPLGKNDGAVKGKRYFDAPAGYGAFVRPDKVEVGEFPPIDEFASDLDSGDEI